MNIDNSELIRKFCPPIADGDSFIYTEMLDRSKKKGNNGFRLVKTFYHRSVEEFDEQMPTIVKLCDLANVRACTRLSMRSYKTVGKRMTELVVEAALSDNWAGMKSLYNRACGIAKPTRKLWLLDVDVIDDDTRDLGDKLRLSEKLVATVPSKKGLHYIVEPWNIDGVDGAGFVTKYGLRVQLHKDNPTNLYIPHGAD